MKVLAITALLCLVAVPCLAGTIPTINAQVNVKGDLKEYVYTLTNDLDSREPISNLAIIMPEIGASGVVTATATGGWGTGYRYRGNNSAWGTGVIGNNALLPGESVAFTLVTRASLPTDYNYKLASYPGYPGNWHWATPSGVYYGTPNLPVPAPEPSALLGLVGGLGTLPFLRRRK